MIIFYLSKLQQHCYAIYRSFQKAVYPGTAEKTIENYFSLIVAAAKFYKIRLVI